MYKLSQPIYILYPFLESINKYVLRIFFYKTWRLVQISCNRRYVRVLSRKREIACLRNLIVRNTLVMIYFLM